LEKLRAQQVLAVAGSLADGAKDIGGIAFVGHRAPDGTAADDLRTLAADVRGRLMSPPALAMVTGVARDRPGVGIAVPGGARERGLKAGARVGSAAKGLGGGGGGKDDLAEGGGSNPAAIGDALNAVEYAVGAA